MTTTLVFHGTVIHCLSLTELEIITNATVIVDQGKGVITHVERNVHDLDNLLAKLNLTNCKVHRLSRYQFLVPGFVDTHAHAPQYVFSGSGMDLQLLDWLNTYTFPIESTFKSVDYAKETYTKVVSRFLRNGTTTCSWFATIHLDACKALSDILEEKGQRAYIGKVNMDQNCPDYYIEKTATSLQETEAFIQYVRGKSNPLLTPVITPRFAITCSSQLMQGLSKLAKKYNVPIQTHLCENPTEIEFTRSLFPASKHYTGIYDDHGLLGSKSYMAHCVHMEEDEVDLLAARQVGVSHCANSNFSLHSGVCDVRRFLNKGMKVGLGTDVAGGFAPSMLDAIRTSFFASKTNMIMHRDQLHKPYSPLSPSELLFLATLGGAQVLGLQDTIGNFVVGKAFDALVVDLGNENGPVDLFGKETEMHLLEKFLFNGSEQNLSQVYVQGRKVSGSS